MVGDFGRGQPVPGNQTRIQVRVPLAEASLVSAEQSNSSVVFGEELILKAYRRLEAGINPELELLRFLTVRGFENIASLHGWYAYAGRPLDATLGVVRSRGLHDATIEEITEIAGYTRGAFYAHFGSKEEAVLEVLQ